MSLSRAVKNQPYSGSNDSDYRIFLSLELCCSGFRTKPRFLTSNGLLGDRPLTAKCRLISNFRYFGFKLGLHFAFIDSEITARCPSVRQTPIDLKSQCHTTFSRTFGGHLCAEMPIQSKILVALRRNLCWNEPSMLPRASEVHIITSVCLQTSGTFCSKPAAVYVVKRGLARPRASRSAQLRTAFLRVETHDEKIRHVVDSQMKSFTVIAIAHRISTIVNYDKILVLDSGSIAEFDDPTVLLSKPESRFAQLAATQGIYHPDLVPTGAAVKELSDGTVMVVTEDV
ncbi:hypothetical protein FB451DRAFT_1162383 [Mycena latifolia]|nr:hypothetical protein FB451DRAFT_1162383 [Mycena latifolia]